MSGPIQKIVAVGATLLGGGLVMGNLSHDHVTTHRKIDQFVKQKHLEYAERNYQEYSPYEIPRRIRHWLADSSWMIPFQRIGMHVGSVGGVLWENALPIWLMGTGLIYGLGSSYSGVFNSMGGISKPLMTGATEVVKSTWMAGKYGIVNSVKAIGGFLPKLVPNTVPKAILTACVAGLGLVFAKTVADELTGHNTEHAVGEFLKHPEHSH